MKILITTECYIPVINGVVTSVVNLEKELTAKGHDVKIITLSQNRYSRQEGNVYYLRSFSIGKIYPNARIGLFMHNKYIMEILIWKPDVIHSQCEFSSFVLAKKISRKLKIPIVHTYHTIYEDYTHYFSPNKSLGKKAVIKFSRQILNHVQAVIAPTKKVYDMLIGYGIKTPIYTVPTGINLKHFEISVNDDKKEQMKAYLGISKDSRILLTVGRLAKEKNIDQLIDYFKKLNRSDVIFLIVGDGPYRITLEQLVKEKDLVGKVIFTGMIPQQEVPIYYHLGEIFISASCSETQGLTYFEALACGLPAVCRADTCLNDVIIDKINGFQYDTFESFQNFINEILDNKDAYNLMSAAAVSMAEKYSTAIFAERLEKIYQETIVSKNKQNN